MWEGVMVFTETLRQKMMLSTFGSHQPHTPWIAHHTAKHAAEAFSSVIGFDIDNTNKRQVLLQEFCEFCD